VEVRIFGSLLAKIALNKERFQWRKLTGNNRAAALRTLYGGEVWSIRANRDQRLLVNSPYGEMVILDFRSRSDRQIYSSEK